MATFSPACHLNTKLLHAGTVFFENEERAFAKSSEVLPVVTILNTSKLAELMRA